MQFPRHDSDAKPRQRMWCPAALTARLQKPHPPPQPCPAITTGSTTWKAADTQGSVKPKHTQEGSEVLGMVLAASQERAVALLGEFQQASASPKAENARVALLAAQAQCEAFTSVRTINSVEIKQ